MSKMPHGALISLGLGSLVVTLSFLVSTAANAQPTQCGFGEANSQWKKTSPKTIAAANPALIPRTDGSVLVCGGDKTVGSATAFCERWDPTTETWSLMPTPMPEGLANAVGVELQDSTVLVCGASQPCFRLDDGGTPLVGNDDSWTTLAGPTYWMSQGQLVETSAGKVLFFTQYTSSASCNVSVFDIANNSWERHRCNDDIPNESFGRMTLTYDDRLVVGPQSDSYGYGEEVDPRGAVFDVASGVWSPTAAAPNPRERDIVLPDGTNGIVTAGGEIKIWDVEIHTKTVDAVSAATGTWSIATPLPVFARASQYRSTKTANGNSLVRYRADWISGVNQQLDSGYYLFNGATKVWGRTCDFAEVITDDNGNPRNYGSLPGRNHGDMIWAPGPDGKIYMLDRRLENPNDYVNNPYLLPRELTVYIFDPTVADADSDGVPDCCDNCIDQANPQQVDDNGNSLGDLCEVCGDGVVAVAPPNTVDTTNLAAIELKRTYRELARIGSTMTVKLEITANTFLTSIDVTDTIPAGATLTSPAGSNVVSLTNVGTGTTITLEYDIELPTTQGFISGQANLDVEPLEEERRTFGIPMTILVFASEGCEDGNNVNGDGCTDQCQVETGFDCPINEVDPYDPDPSAGGTVGCMPACGDGLIIGDETCDDGNNDSGDGCSGRRRESGGYPTEYCAAGYPDDLADGCQGCFVEIGFTCPTPGEACVVDCGDGITVGDEECDDGNTDSGDGCSDTCEIEEGWACPGRYDCVRDANGDPIEIPSPYGSEQACGSQYFHDHCIPVCGDGVLLGDETCDDGNNSGNDGCSSRNMSGDCAQQYADGNLSGSCIGCRVEPGYTCPTVNAPCGASCGDGFKRGDESCDDGNTAVDDGCDGSCEVEDGWVCPARYDCIEDADGNEFCGEFFAENCMPECGDGSVDGDEGCDDGNNVSNDGCSSRNMSGDCAQHYADGGELPEYCVGCQLEVGFTCDQTGSCSPACGDSLVVGDEECEDGNDVAGDGCFECQIEDGWYCPSQTQCDTVGGIFQCFNETIWCYPFCGDDMVVGDETCDDGNTQWNDGCSGREHTSWCAQQMRQVAEGTRPASDISGVCLGCRDEICGDGFIQDDEACDDGNTADNDGCSADCLFVESGFDCYEQNNQSICDTQCDDGIVRGDEACDDGNDNGGDGCNHDCQIEIGWTCDADFGFCEPTCGDGFLVGEEACDDGNTVSGDGCDSGCNSIEWGWVCQTTSFDEGFVGCCAFSAVDQAECTPVTDGGDCPSDCPADAPGTSCQWIERPGGNTSCTAICGDGQIVDTNNEACDDGNLTVGDGCSPGCQVEPGWSCPSTGAACQPICGDGVKVSGEFCDDGDTDNGDGCSSQCLPEAGWLCQTPGEDCTPECGDGLLRGSEGCDDGNLVSGDGCSATCTIELCASDAECDDGDACNGDEVCDATVGCIPGPALTCDDGDPCNGVETCESATGCVAGTPVTCNVALETKILPNGTGDGYATFATDPFGAFRSSECGGGLNADGTTKVKGAAEFDPSDAALGAVEGRKGIVCGQWISLFDGQQARRQLNVDDANWGGGEPLMPDGTPLTQGLDATHLTADDWIGDVRRTRYHVADFPGLEVTLDQSAACATLTQRYRFTNTSTSPITFRLNHYSDTDLVWRGGYTQNRGYKADYSDLYETAMTTLDGEIMAVLRVSPDPAQTMEGWRLKQQRAAGWGFIRAQLYYGWPNPDPTYEFKDCTSNASVPCPPSYLNQIRYTPSTQHPDLYGIPPDANIGEVDDDVDGDGWADTPSDAGQGFQASYTLAPGQSAEWRTTFSGVPAECELSAHAGADATISVSTASNCEGDVMLDASASLTGSATATVTWRDATGSVLGTGMQLTATLANAGTHIISAEVCLPGGDCDTDFVEVVAMAPAGQCVDTDGDGVADASDLDDDNDGVLDLVEINSLPGRVSPLTSDPSADDDGDGTPNWAEGDVSDFDGDGTPDHLDLDSDGDGLLDIVEGDDSDGDGTTDHGPLDTDGDGVIDLAQFSDADKNGVHDAYDASPAAHQDSDGDTRPDRIDAVDGVCAADTFGECVCGDTWINVNESCDDGNVSAGDGCSPSCQVEPGFDCFGLTPPGDNANPGGRCDAVCGDGLRVGVEFCDDGNTTSGDGCSMACLPELGWTCPVAGAPCVTACGDGIRAGAEGCDDGNQGSGDGCDQDCEPEPGFACPTIGGPCVRLCGNGVLDDGEQCDDGNLTMNDGCGFGCQVEPGFTCPAVNNLCVAICGDGVVLGDEECDDGDTEDGDGCNAICQLEENNTGCGNALLDAGEQCDDGNLTSQDGCSSACQLELGFQCQGAGIACQLVCGDGVRVFPEGCDDGGTALGDGCDDSCRVEPGWTCGGPFGCLARCGDGLRLGTEGCDDGNTDDNDGCSADCDIEAGFACAAAGLPCEAADALEAVDDSATVIEGGRVEVVVTDNDSGDSIFVKSVGDAEVGEVELVDRHTVAYAPPDDFEGDVAVSYVIIDRAGETASAEIVFTVQSVDTSGFKVVSAAPVCDGGELVEAASAPFLGRPPPLAFRLALAGGSGRYTANSKPVPAVFTVPANNGKATEVQITDEADIAAARPKNVVGEITCKAPEATIEAVDDEATTAAGTVTLDVLANDDGNGLSLTRVGKPSSGEASVTASGTVTYQASDGFAGVDRFVYGIKGADGSEDFAEVSVTVPAAVGVAARDDVVSTLAGVNQTVAVLDNDTEGAMLTDVGDASHGTVVIDDDVVIYTAESGYAGEDSFTYTVGLGPASDTATVTVLVRPSGSCPDLKLSDARPRCDGNGQLTVAFEVSEGSGSYLINGSASDGEFVSGTFEPGAIYQFHVVDNLAAATCRARVVSGKATCDPASLVSAEADIYTTTQEVAIIVRPVANDTGEGLATVGVGEPEHGSLSALALGVYRYTPPEGFVGEDSFTYVIEGATGARDTGLVAIDVAAADEDTCQDFIAKDLAVECIEGGDAYRVGFTINGGSGTFAVGGEATLHRNQWTEATASGEAVQVEVFDNAADCAPVQVLARHTCRPASQSLSANPDGVSVLSGESTAFRPLDNDTGEGLALVELGTPAHGELFQGPDGNVVYAPEAGFVGVDSVLYTISGDGGASAVGTAVFYVSDADAPTVGCATCLTEAIDDRLRPSTGDVVEVDVRDNDNGPDLTVTDYLGSLAGEASFEAGVLVIEAAADVSGQTLAYTVVDAHGVSSDGVIVFSADPAVPCQANAGSFDPGPSVACGFRPRTSGFTQTTGYRQALVALDASNAVVAVHQGPTWAQPVPPGTYRFVAVNYRPASGGTLPSAGQSFTPDLVCADVSAPRAYVELAPITISATPNCTGAVNGYELDVSVSGGEPDLGTGNYTTTISAVPPYTPGQVVIITAEDAVGCSDAHVATMPASPCFGGTNP